MKNVRLLSSYSASLFAAVTSTLALTTVLMTSTTTALADEDSQGDHDTRSPSAVIVSPNEGAMFLVGTKIPIHAFALNFTDAVSSVQFFSGSNSLGTVTKFLLADRDENAELATLVWSNAPAGDFTLTAQATDAAGVTVTSAPVSITVVTDFPPVVHIVKPRNNSFILGPTNVHLLASAFDPDGTIAGVTFFAGTNDLGTVTNPPVVVIKDDDNEFHVRPNGYSLTWSNAPVGTFTITAVAKDNSGVLSTSAPVTVNIVTDLPPVVQIVRPADDDHHFVAPANIHLVATASDEGGSISNVVFFENGVSVGTVTNGQTVTNENGKVKTYYAFDWNYVLAGKYKITAVATDNNGESTTSAPIVINVKSPPPPRVKIIHPQNGARFLAPANIIITADPDYFLHPLTNVTFLSGTNVLAVFTNNALVYNYHWMNVPMGNYSLTVTAHDMGGASATSVPVNISVTTNQPPRNRD